MPSHTNSKSGNTKLTQVTAPKTKVNVSHTTCFNVHKQMKNSIKYIKRPTYALQYYRRKFIA